MKWVRFGNGETGHVFETEKEKSEAFAAWRKAEDKRVALLHLTMRRLPPVEFLTRSIEQYTKEGRDIEILGDSMPL